MSLAEIRARVPSRRAATWQLWECWNVGCFRAKAQSIRRAKEAEEPLLRPALARSQATPLPRPPNVPLSRALSLLDGIWGVLKGSWRVLVVRRVESSLAATESSIPKTLSGWSNFHWPLNWKPRQSRCYTADQRSLGQRGGGPKSTLVDAYRPYWGQIVLLLGVSA